MRETPDNFVPYGPSFPSLAAANDAIEDYYATGELSFEERANIVERNGRYVILVAEGY